MKNLKLLPFLLALTLIASLLAPPLLRADDGDIPAAAPAVGTTASDQLVAMADAGQFGRVLTALKSNGPADPSSPVAALIRDIEHYQTDRAAQAAKQEESYKTAYEKMKAQVKAGKLEEAVFTALVARDLAVDKATFLREPEVLDLIKRADTAAVEAEKTGDWIEAMSLYRSLDDLFDDYATYHKQVKLATNHVRLLRLYAPNELERLLKQRNERLSKAEAAEANDAAKTGDAKTTGKIEDAAKPKAEPTDKDKEPAPKADEIHFDKETWQQKLEDVDEIMLKQSIKQAAEQHVAGHGYAPLLKGAAGAMIVLADTRPLAATFPSMADAGKLKQFRDQFTQIIQEIGARDKISSSDALDFENRMLGINAATINLPEQVVVYELTEGAMETLDEFSTVIWPHDKQSFARNFQGKFYGVGIQISQKLDPKSRRERLYVVSPLPDTPAYRAGILPGDIIAKVGDASTVDWSLDQAVREITGEEGTPVVLTIERSTEAVPLELKVFKLVRAEIPIESIRGWELHPGGGWGYTIDHDAKIGYVRLSQFIPQSADDLDAAMNQVEKEEGGLNALILDLRFDPGGLLSSAVEVANRFVPSGTIVSTVSGDGTVSKEEHAKPSHAHAPLPVIVLVNQGSASASEIVSGALQAYHKALIVGTRSFGKGSVQDVFPIERNRLTGDAKAYLKLTTQYYRLPNKRIIHRLPGAKTWGVEPDVNIPMTADQIAANIEVRQKADVLHSPNEVADPKHPATQPSELLTKSLDPQLEAAILILKTQLVANQVALAQGK